MNKNTRKMINTNEQAIRMELDNPSNPRVYREFKGTFPDAMAELRLDGRQPLTSYEILERRVEMFQKFHGTPQASNWWDYSWDTATACSMDTVGNLKITHNAQQLYDLTLQSISKISHTLPLTDREYKGLEGFSFTNKELSKMVLSKSLTNSDQIKSHPIWQALANEDSTLLSDYATAYMQLRIDMKLVSDRNSGHSECWPRQGMEIYLPSSSHDLPRMSTWVIDRFANDSNASGVNYLDNGCRLLAGKLVA